MASTGYRWIGEALCLRRDLVRCAKVLSTISCVLLVRCSFAQQGNEKTFPTPGDAVVSLYDAARADDQQTIAAIFGSNSSDLLHTGDKVADNKMRDDFL